MGYIYNKERNMTDKTAKPMEFGLKMLAIRDYGTAELRARMASKGFSTVEIEGTITKLEQKKLLDDYAYIAKIIEKYTAKQPSGREFIRNYMEQKGLKKEQFEEALEKVKERETALLAFKMKFKPVNKTENPSKTRQKAANYLQTKGFDYDIIVEILNQEIKGEPDYEQ